MITLFELIICISINRGISASALPTQGNHTDPVANAHTGWVSTPDVRGTFDLISSSLLTLALCVWTAYHPNVHAESRAWYVFCRRTSWMLIAIFVPEVVLFCAWEQWWMAKKLKKEVNALNTGNAVDNDETITCEACSQSCTANNGSLSMDGLDVLPNCTTSNIATESNLQCCNLIVSENEQCPPHISPEAEGVLSAEDELEPNAPQVEISVAKSQEPWTIEQAFFAVGGGFAVESSAFSSKPLLIFTPRGIIELAKAGLLPHASVETVIDKSKADAIAKALVCIQAGWFCIQCLARICQRMPLTLLEIHTFAHVLCAFCMYYLWMKKPYDVASPILCEDERILDMAALFDLDAKTCWWARDITHGKQACCQKSNITVAQADTVQCAPSPLHPLKRWWNDNMIENSDPIPPCLDSHPDLNPKFEQKVLNQYDRAARAVEYLKSRGSHFFWFNYSKQYWTNNESGIHLQPLAGLRFSDVMVVPIRRNLYIDGEGYLSILTDNPKRNKLHVHQAAAFTIFSVVYGAVHLAAWNSHFPTRVELWMWRSAAIVMASAPLVSGIVLLIVTALRDIYKTRTKLKTLHLRYAGLKFMHFGFFLVTPLALLLITAYPIGRIYVLTEAFASIRDVPIGTYQTVSWSQFMPHIG